MGDNAGHPAGDLTVLVTREVRWFSHGVLPQDIWDWFTDGGALGVEEHRVDRYDLASAQLGIGVKYRGNETFDAKYRLTAEDGVELADGLCGRVEDWVKISKPMRNDGNGRVEHPIVVDKQIVTRRFFLDGASDILEPGASGSDLELVSVTTMDRTAWSLCLETFGHPGQRTRAFDEALGWFLAETPLPAGMSFCHVESCGYPHWIGQYVEAA